MADPLHLQPDPEPPTEQVRLGNGTVEVDPATAATIRGAFEAMAADYGARLEEYRRQALQSIGTPPVQQPWQPPQPPEPQFGVPDPDLLFQNKGQWSEGLGNAIQQQLTGVREENLRIAQGLTNAFQQELNRRDQAQQAKQTHDAAMAEMLERRGLGEHTRVVQAVYTELYPKLQHMPLEMALDRIGMEAQSEIERIRSGEKWTMTPAQEGPGITQRPPATLRSARRSSAPRPAPAQPEQGLQEPGGGLGMMGRIIRKRQAALMGTETA